MNDVYFDFRISKDTYSNLNFESVSITSNLKIAKNIINHRSAKLQVKQLIPFNENLQEWTKKISDFLERESLVGWHYAIKESTFTKILQILKE